MGKNSAEVKGLPTEAAAVILISAIVAAVPLLFTTALSDSFYLPKLTLLAVLVIVTLTVLAGGRILSGPLTSIRSLILSPLDIAVLAFVAIAALSTITAASPALSFLGRYRTPEGLLSILSYAGLYFAVSRVTWTKARLGILFSAALLGGAGVAAYAFIQAAGLDFATWKDIPYSSDRFGSTLGNPIMLAGYMAIAAFAFFALVSLAEKLPARASLLIVASCVAAGSLMLSTGRAGAIGLAAGLAGAVFFARRATRGATRPPTRGATRGQGHPRARLLILVGIALVSGAAAAAAAGYVNTHADTTKDAQSESSKIDQGSQPASGQDSKFDDTSARDRITVWLSTPRLINDRAAIGWGPDSFQLMYPAYQSLASAKIESADGELGRRAEDAHNIFLQLAATLGLPGFACFLFLTAMIFYEGYGVLAQRPDVGATPLSPAEAMPRPVIAAFLLAGITAFLVSSLLTPVMSGSFIFFWLFAGILVSLARKPALSPALAPPEPSDASLAAGIDFSRLAMLMVLLPLAGLLLILVLLPIGADIQYSKAERAWSRGDMAAATPGYRNAMRINPFRDKYTGQFGQRLISTGSTLGNVAMVNSGIELLAEAWDKNKYEFTYPLALGVASLKLLETDPQALSRSQYYLREARRLAPNDARAQYYYAIAILSEGRKPQDAAPALAPLKKATIIAPDYFDAQKALGSVNLLLGDKSAALAAFRAADRLRPNDPDVTKGIKSLSEDQGKSGNTTSKSTK